MMKLAQNLGLIALAALVGSEWLARRSGARLRGE